MSAERFPVLLADGPGRRASAMRPLLDAAGILSRPYRGEASGPALLLVDSQRPDAARLLVQLPPELQLRAVAVPEDGRLLVPALEEAGLGLGQPDLALAAQVAQIASELAGAADTHALLKLVALRARALVEAEASTAYLVDCDTGDLEVQVAEGGTNARPRSARIPRARGVAGWVVQNRLPLRVNAPDQDARFDAIHDARVGAPARNLAAVPIFFRGEVVGVLEAVNRAGGGFFDQDLRALASLAQHVGIALNHTRAAEALRATAVAARKRSADMETLVQERTAVLMRAKQEWEQTFDAIDEPLAVLDGFTVRRANRAYANRAKVPVTEVVGRTCYSLLGKSAPCAGCPLARAPRSLRGELELVEGQRSALSGFVLRDGGVVVHYRDVTAQRALEAKLRDTDRLAVVGQLAAGAAHEINNPLGFVTSNLATLEGYLEDLAGIANRVDLAGALASSGKAAEAAALLVRAREAADDGVEQTVEEASQLIAESRSGLARVANIVRALKELAKQQLQAGAEPVPLDIALELAVRTVGGGHPEVEVAWGGRASSPVRGHALELQHAIEAVLENALQAAEAGGGKVEVGTEHLGEEARITIADDGPGIDPAIRERVFEPFFTTRGIGGGVGLGLTAAYGIVTRHGGRIDLMPRVGGGTVAVIALPASSPP